MPRRPRIIRKKGSDSGFFSGHAPPLTLHLFSSKKAPEPRVCRNDVLSPPIDSSHYPHRIGCPAPLPSIFSDQVRLKDKEVRKYCGGLSVDEIRRAAMDILVEEGVPFQEIEMSKRRVQIPSTATPSLTPAPSSADTGSATSTGTKGDTPCPKCMADDSDAGKVVPTLVINSEISRAVFVVSPDPVCKKDLNGRSQLENANVSKIGMTAELRWPRWMNVLQRLKVYAQSHGIGNMSVDIADFSYYFAELPMTFFVERLHPLYMYLDLLREKMLDLVSSSLAPPSSPCFSPWACSCSSCSGQQHGHVYGNTSIDDRQTKRRIASLSSICIDTKDKGDATGTTINDIAILRRGDCFLGPSHNPLTIMVLCEHDPEAVAARYGDVLLEFCRDRQLYHMDTHLSIEFVQGGRVAPEPAPGSDGAFSEEGRQRPLKDKDTDANGHVGLPVRATRSPNRSKGVLNETPPQRSLEAGADGQEKGVEIKSPSSTVKPWTSLH